LDYINTLSVLSSSQQVVDRLPTGTVSSSTQISNVLVTSASYAETASLALGISGSLAVNTDQLAEGVTNLYYTDARVKTKLSVENVHSASFLGTATTTNLTEGINLYFTNQRVKDALPGVVSSSAQVQPILPAGTVSSSGQVTITATTGYSTFSSSLAAVDAGQTTRIDNLASATSSYAINATIQGQLAGVVSSSTQVKPLLPDGTVTSSAQTVASLAGQFIVPSGSNFQGVVSGSGTQYRLVVPVGTNLYAL
jgi:hypothetical protein